MKIGATYTKNWLIAEYMTETFTDSQEKEIPDELAGEEIIYEKVKLHAQCATIVWKRMLQAGFITKEKYKQEVTILKQAVEDAAAVVEAKLGKAVGAKIF